MVLNIISLNVRGLGNKLKRKSVFEFYRNKCHVLCLQETHATDENLTIWKNEWGGQVIASNGTSSARGVMMLFKHNFPGTISQVQKDVDGRFVCCKIEVDNSTIALANIYAPNNDVPEFFEKQFRTAFECHNQMVIVGDYNTVMDPELDRKDSQNNNKKAAAKIHALIDELRLNEIWRLRHPESKRYSWIKLFPSERASRIDYAIISQGLSDVVHDTYYLNGVCTDHSAFFVGFNFKDDDRGAGYWKMNCSLSKN